MVKLLLVSLRYGETAPAVAAAEYRDICESTGLSQEQTSHLVIDSTNVELPDLANFDGVIVGGSSLNITNETWDEWQLHIHRQLEILTEADIPVFLICFGASWLAHHVGGTVGHSHAETSGKTIVQLTHDAARDVLARHLPQSFTSLTGHTEAVENLPAADNITILADGPTCPVQLIRVGDSTWASQFHAEMDAVAMKNRMDFFYDYGYFSPEDYLDIVNSLPSIDTKWSNELLAIFVRYCATRAATS